VYVEECSDELWVGVKCQSNTEIAGSPRNAFRCSVVRLPSEVEHCIGYGSYRITDPKQTPNADGPRAAVRQWGISFIVERETAQTHC
jgi:hypothetical protein